MSELEISSIGALIKKEAQRYALSRKYAHKTEGNKKVTLSSMYTEVMAARIIGEMSAIERVITSLVANPEWTRDDLEAELHLFVVKCNNQVVQILKETGLRSQAGKIIDIDDVLEGHNYFAKETP